MPDNSDLLIPHIYFILYQETDGGWEETRKLTEHHTIYWIIRGEGTFFKDNLPVSVEKGSFLYAKPGEALRYKSDTKNPMCFIKVRFTCAMYKYINSEWNIHPIEALDLPFLIPAKKDQYTKCNEYFHTLYHNFITMHDQGRTPAVSVLQQIIHHFKRIQLDTSKENVLPLILMKIKQYIDLHYMESLVINDLADMHTISPSYLRKLFLKQLGCTPKKYLDQIRNHHALNLVKFSDLPFKTISLACGYADEYHFSRRFKEINGSPPSAYR